MGTALVLLATLFLIQARMPLGFLATWHTLAHVQSESPGPFALGHFPVTQHPTWSSHGVVVAKVQDPALGLVEPHPVGLSPSLQPVQAPVQSPPALQQIGTPTRLGVICEFTKGGLNPLSDHQ
ncbi:hypothetical protein WISP_148725 [Willisornis vidua]|uniref:Secreted protein n=1 Tax=Willisornis vidua TaxID=1566151 RepID=A0ABQ9CK57_9PASS|nr:hypothetical protein WISP_148725 [Willisornis vidua]